MIFAPLLESLWFVAAAWVAAELLLIALWSWRRSRTWARAVWIGFAALPVLLAASSLVVTDRERIRAVCRDLADAVENSAPEVIERRLADDFESEGLDREAFIRRVRNALDRYKVWNVALHGLNVELLTDDAGKAEFRTTANVRGEGVVYEWFASRWRLGFARRGDGWLVTRVERLPDRGGSALRLDELFR